jgi:hypothetical protein
MTSPDHSEGSGMIGFSNKGQCGSSQKQSSDPKTIDEHGLKILADVISHSSCFEKTCSPGESRSEMKDTITVGELSDVKDCVLDVSSMTKVPLLGVDEVLMGSIGDHSNLDDKTQSQVKPHITKVTNMLKKFG